MNQFPSNSKRTERSRAEPKNVERVVQGEAVRRKVSRTRRVTQNLIGGDAQSVWGYVSTDILAPAFRDLIEDAFIGFITKLVRGDDSRYSGRSRGGRPGHTDYRGISSRGRPGHHRDEPRRDLSRRSRSSHNFDEIVLEHRVDAEEVLDRLDAMLDKYESVTVADFYDLCGVTAQYTDQKYGWTTIAGAAVKRARGGGFVISMPAPEPLD